MTFKLIRQQRQYAKFDKQAYKLNRDITENTDFYNQKPITPYRKYSELKTALPTTQQSQFTLFP